MKKEIMFKTKNLLLGIVTLSLFIVGCANTSSPYYVSDEKLKTIKFLDEAQLKELFNDKTIIGNHFKSQSKFSISYSSDGTYKGSIRDGAKMISGKWSIKGDTQCHTRSSGKQSCRKYYIEDGKYYSFNPEKMYITSSFESK